ncbi:MAG: LytR family transcriptional regulator [Bacillus sp. (in: firmicutes)]
MTEQRTRRKKKKKKKWPKILGIIFLLFVIAIGAFAFKVWSDVSNLADTMHTPLDRTSDKRTEALDLKDKQPFSVLLLGVDERKNDSGRSDTMIVLSVNPEKGKLKMLSIPRDTRVEIIGKGKQDKINHAYAFGGAEMSLDTVENFLDIPIDYYVKVNMDGFKELVEAVDGVSVNNEFAFTYEGVTFPEGFIELDGEDALKYTRMRYEDPNGDFGRQNRQRQVIQSIINKGASASIITNYKDILEALGDNVETNLSFDDMYTIQKNYRNAASGIDQMTIAGTGTKIGGIYYLQVSEEEKARIQKELKDYLNM